MRDKKFEQWALPIIKKITKVLLVEHFYPVKLEWQERIRDGATAGFAFSHPYQSLTILYTDGLLKDWKNDKNDAIMVLTHEVCHALTDPLYNAGFMRFSSKEQIEDEREKLTDHLANIVLKNNLIAFSKTRVGDK